MKHLKLYSIVAIVVAGIVTSCKDESLQLVPEWESGVHGFGGFATGSPTNFVYQNPTTALNLNLKWVSVDGKNAVTKIDVFVLFNEPYTDKDGNPAIARHGGTDGKLLASFSGSTVPANRANAAIAITQPGLYELYKNATFDYDADGTATPVFANPGVPGRAAATPFVKGDAFSIRWEFTTEDGRKFYKWGVSVCTEYPGGNCAVSWGVICTSNLAGTYNVVSTFESPDYGFSSAAPDFSYGPGNDGSVANGVQTYNGIAVTADVAAASYIIPDITNGFEPIMWGNVKVRGVISDQCGTLVLVKTLTAPYAYTVKPGSKVLSPTTFQILWNNPYNESGISTFTKVP